MVDGDIKAPLGVSRTAPGITEGCPDRVFLPIWFPTMGEAARSSAGSTVAGGHLRPPGHLGGGSLS